MTWHLFITDGNTDGVFKGKRYFKCSTNHGKFVRITNILSVLPVKVRMKSNLQNLLHHLFISSPEHVLSSTGGPFTTKGHVQCPSWHFKQIQRTLSKSTITVNKKFCLPLVKFFPIWHTCYFVLFFLVTIIKFYTVYTNVNPSTSVAPTLLFGFLVSKRSTFKTSIT